jgi:ribose 5-phosphate isomerase B
MRIAIGADHRGCEAAARVSERMEKAGHEVIRAGTFSEAPSDYPDPAYEVAAKVGGGAVDRGMLICGSGIGMSIAANKVRGVRAALVHDELSAEMSRAHNDANVLCLSADLLGPRLIDKIVDLWMETPFEGGRHARRVNKIKAIEEGRAPYDAGGVGAAGEAPIG